MLWVLYSFSVNCQILLEMDYISFVIRLLLSAQSHPSSIPSFLRFRTMSFSIQIRFREFLFGLKDNVRV